MSQVKATFAIPKPEPPAVGEEVLRRQALAARDTPRVGEHAFHRVDLVPLQEVLGGVDVGLGFGDGHGSVPSTGGELS